MDRQTFKQFDRTCRRACDYGGKYKVAWLQNSLPIQQIEEQSTSHDSNHHPNEVDRFFGSKSDCLYPVELCSVRFDRPLKGIGPLGKVNKPLVGLLGRVFEEFAHSEFLSPAHSSIKRQAQ